VFLLCYNLGLKLYLLILKGVSPFNIKAKKWLKGRASVFAELEATFQGETKKVVWFHAASLGEFEQARPVMERFREEFKAYRILLTFFSPSGYEIRKNYPGADFVFYLPLDTKKNAKRFISITQPALAFFVKYEFWFHYLNELKIGKIPAISFSAIFRENQLFFKPYGKAYKALLTSFRKIFVQDRVSYSLLQKEGFSSIEIAGDTRFDRVLEIAKRRKDLPLVNTFKGDKKVLVIGSAWEADLRIILQELQAYPDLKLLIAPHEIDEPILKMIEATFSSSIRFSKATLTEVAKKQVLIIDNIGILSSLYFYGEFAFIGGAFGKGLHNTLEAAVYGIPLFFGPNYLKFKEACDLIEAGAAFSVKDKEAFRKEFKKIYSDTSLREAAAKKAGEYVVSNQGATEKIISFTKSMLQE